MYKLYERSATQPLTLEQAKAHLRVTHNYDDTVIADALKEAVAYVEARSNQTLVQTTWDLYLLGFRYPIYLDKSPVSAVTSIKYYDDDILTTLDSAEYRLINPYRYRAFVEPIHYWPSYDNARSDAIQIRFVSGFSVLPNNLLRAVKLALGDYYESRENSIIGTISSQAAISVDRLCELERAY